MASSVPSSFLDEPISPPPPGQRSDFINPASRAPELYITAGVCLSLILVFAGLRFYAKVFIRKKKNWDDLTCTLGLLAAISFISISVATISGGAYGLHQWDVTIRDFSKEQLLLSLTIESIYGPCIWLIKLSLFVLYLEIFGVLRWLRMMCHAGIMLTGLFYFATMFAFLILCSPRNDHSQIGYLTALASPRCSRVQTLSVTTGAVNIVSDLYLVMLPLPAVWSLQLPLRRKIGVSAMFLTGSVACVASILGLYNRVNLAHTTDNTWATIPTWLTSIVEMTAGILVCCMPTTAAVLGRLKAPVSSFLASSRKGLIGLTRSPLRTRHESLGSTSNLHPPHNNKGPSRSRENRQAQYEMQKPWSGQGNGWGGCEAESTTTTTAKSPLEETSILKSTKVEVKRGSTDADY